MRERIPIEEVSFVEFMACPAAYRQQADDYWSIRGKWIDAEMQKRKWVWILICGGEAVEGSSDMTKFPDEEELKALGEKYGFIPFAYTLPPMIEEETPGSLLAQMLRAEDPATLELQESADALKRRFAEQCIRTLSTGGVKVTFAIDGEIFPNPSAVTN